MRPFLLVLTVLVLAADALVFLRFRRWLNRLAQHPDEPLPAGEERQAQRLIKLTGILSAAGTLLVLILLFA